MEGGGVGGEELGKEEDNDWGNENVNSFLKL